jgi:hypothetical protein
MDLSQDRLLKKVYRHVYEWLQTGFGLVIGFIDLLQNVATSNYTAIANSHSQQFTTAALSLLSLLHLHQPLSGNGFQRRSPSPDSDPYVTADGQSASLS